MTELLIQRPDDSREYDSTIVRFSEDEEYNTANINPRSFRNANNPMIEAVKSWLSSKLKISRRNMYRNTYRRSRGYYTPSWEQPKDDIKEGEQFAYNITLEKKDIWSTSIK